MTDPGQPRCLRCRRAPRACYCARIRPFAAGTVFAILLHPREARRTVGTGRMASLLLKDSVLIEGDGPSIDRDPRVAALLADPKLSPWVLYPGAAAVDLSAPSEGRRPPIAPSGARPLVFVIDGTWPQAKKMIRESRALTSLPQLRFTPPRQSSYRFRRQPAPACFSTIEAIHEVIRLLDSAGAVPAPEGAAHDRLLELFDWMVELQLRHGQPKPEAAGTAAAPG